MAARISSASRKHKRLQQILERADCKKVRFHDLRNTFATMSLEHGMDRTTVQKYYDEVRAEMAAYADT